MEMEEKSDYRREPLSCNTALRSPISKCADDLEFITKSFEPDDLKNRIEFIPFS
jgi:hypothetical protein